MRKITPISKEKKYINSNVYNNDNLEIKDSFLRLEELLREELQNPNDLKIKIWIKNYLSFVKRYEQVLEREILVSYIKEMFKKYDRSGIYYSNLDNLMSDLNNQRKVIKRKPKTQTEEKKETIISAKNEDNIEKVDVKKEAEPLKILNIKKYKFSFAKQNILKALALIGIGSTVGVPAALISVGVLELFRIYAVSNPKLKEFLENHEIQVDNKQTVNTELYNDGVVRERTIMQKTNFLKRLLMNFNYSIDKFIMKDDSMISADYKKNKITSMLLDVKNEKSLSNRTKLKKDIVLEESNNIEMHKGMGKC